MGLVGGGGAIERSGKVVVFNGYAWRGRSTGAVSGSGPADILAEMRESVMFSPDQSSCNVANPTPNHWLNLGAFAPTPVGAGRIGNAGVGICEGPGTVAVAGGLGKIFLIIEKLKLRFEASFSNILNHPNFAAPPTDVSSPATFGVTQTVQSAENGGNRVGQMSLHLDF